MKLYKNKKLQNLFQKIDGIVYEEEWKEIEGFDGNYLVSSFGRIKSLERVVSIIRHGHPVDLFVKERIIAQFLDGSGYPGVRISKGGIPHWFHTHRLVAQHFIPNPKNLPEVNHLKGRKTDLRKWKLEWSTKSDNIKHAFRIGLNKSLFQEFGKKNPKSKPVRQYTKDGVFIKEFAGQQLASRETGIDQSLIWISCNKPNRKAGGYIWKYAKGFGLGDRGASRTHIRSAKNK